MKVLGTFYCAYSASQLAPLICPELAEVNVIEALHCKLLGDAIHLELEGQGDVLIFGEFDLPLQALEAWLTALGELKISCSIDVHGDAARLIRRHVQ